MFIQVQNMLLIVYDFEKAKIRLKEVKANLAKQY